MEKWSKHVKSRWKSLKVSPKELPIVEVLWWDAHASAIHNWEVSVPNECMRVVTLGYLIEEDDEAITVASMVNCNHIGHALSIPRGCIYDMRVIESMARD